MATFARREFLAGGLLVAIAPLVPWRLQRQFNNGGELALLAHFGLAEPIRVWSRSGTLRYGGFEWLGINKLGTIKAPVQNATLGLKQVVFDMRGLPPDASTIAQRVRDCEAQVWIAAVRDGRLISEPFLILEALLDYQEWEGSEDGSVTCRIHGNVGLWTSERSVNKAWTDETQKDQFPDDTGLSLMPELMKKDIRWRLED